MFGKNTLINGINESNTFKTRIDDLGNGSLYKGEAIAGTSESTSLWRISKISTVGSVTSFDYAEGNSDFVHKWSDRDSYIYS